ncbi:cytochrome P450 [Chaetomium sp. MPI-SDFR-AT-0129]|nr:cytochrome P450 [Chaetomium sp. MPI-SDFR-AT-0129]
MGLLVEYGDYILSGFVLAVIIRIFTSRKTIRRNGEALRTPPGTLPLVGNGIKFLQPRWDLLDWFNKCQCQFGYETLALTVPTFPSAVLIQDPRNLEFVFKNESLFTKGAFVKRRSWDLFGNGIINADGDFWKLQRKAGSAFLNTANLKVLTDVLLPRYISESLDDLHLSTKRDTVDLQHVFHEITTKLMGKMAYNMEMHADDIFSQSFDFASGATAKRFQNPLWLVTEYFLGSEFRRSVSAVKEFGRHIVANAVQGREEQTAKDEPTDPDSKVDHISGSLIRSLLDALGDEQIVADAALNYLSAGRDTTGQALTWTFYLLLQHPEAVTKIRAEVQDLLDQQMQQQPDSPSPTLIISSNPPILNADLTLFTPQSLPYTTAAFHEALRLYPPIPFEFRQAQADTTLPDGTFLPRHSVVMWCLWAMQRSQSTWGYDAEDFRPERFLVCDDEHQGQGQSQTQDDQVRENKKNSRHFAVGKSTSEFPVFHGGVRTCLGRKMAEAIAVQVIPSVVWGFDLEQGWEGPLEGRRSHTSLTLPMEGGLPVKVRRRVVD